VGVALLIPPKSNIPDPPEPLVSFNGVRDGAVVLSPTSETMTGVFTNPYLGSNDGTTSETGRTCE
jgi:hypothetical protein